RLGEQEYLFMAGRWPVSDALRHRVRFCPYDLTPNPPSGLLQCDCETVRDHAEVFGFEIAARNYPAGMFPLSFRPLVARLAATVAAFVIRLIYRPDRQERFVAECAVVV